MKQCRKCAESELLPDWEHLFKASERCRKSVEKRLGHLRARLAEAEAIVDAARHECGRITWSSIVDRAQQAQKETP